MLRNAAIASGLCALSAAASAQVIGDGLAQTEGRRDQRIAQCLVQLRQQYAGVVESRMRQACERAYDIVFVPHTASPQRDAKARQIIERLSRQKAAADSGTWPQP